MKIKFKKSERETGRFAYLNSKRYTRIIVDGSRVGALHYEGTGKAPQEVKIKFMKQIEATQEKPCPWEWVTLTHRANSEPEAREWVKVHMESIMSKIKIYMGDKEND